MSQNEELLTDDCASRDKSPSSNESGLGFSISGSSSSNSTIMQINESKLGKKVLSNHNSNEIDLKHTELKDLKADALLRTNQNLIQERKPKQQSDQQGNKTKIINTCSLTSRSNAIIEASLRQSKDKSPLKCKENNQVDKKTTNNNNKINESIMNSKCLVRPEKPEKPERLRSLSFKLNEKESLNQSISNDVTNDVCQSQYKAGHDVKKLKSLLKKLSNNSKVCTHSRRVTFNQTVMVFCEEIEAPYFDSTDDDQRVIDLGNTQESLLEPMLINEHSDNNINHDLDYHQTQSAFDIDDLPVFSDSDDNLDDDENLERNLITQQDVEKVKVPDNSQSVNYNEIKEQKLPSKSVNADLKNTTKSNIGELKDKAILRHSTENSEFINGSNSNNSIHHCVVSTDNRSKIVNRSQPNVNFLPNAQTQVIKRFQDNHTTKNQRSVKTNSLQISDLINHNTMKKSISDLKTKQSSENSSMQTKCYICNALDSENIKNHSQITIQKNHTLESNLNNINKTFLNTKVPMLSTTTNTTTSSETKQPIGQSSCKSCNNESLSNIYGQNNLILGAAPITPLSCEIVNIVDQSGNKIKALSVVYPNRIEGQNALATRRLIIANESILQAQQNMEGAANLNQFATQAANQTQQANVIRGIRMNTNQVFKISNINSNIKTILRPVYLVQQPLEANFRNGHFPDAHEVRRLDGLNAGTDYNNSSRTSCDQRDNDHLNETQIPTKFKTDEDNEAEDPTFGFSSRPPVKGLISQNLVSTNANCNTEKSKTILSHQFKSQTINRKPYKADDLPTAPSTSHSMTNIQAFLFSNNTNPKTNSINNGLHESKSKDNDIRPCPRLDSNNLNNETPTLFAYGRYNSFIGSQRQQTRH